MIVIDSSALIAVILFEPERQRFLDIIAEVGNCAVSAVTILETRIVTYSRLGAAGVDRLESWLVSFAPEIAPFDEQQSAIAFQAFKTYGKGIHSTARLNFGDCASYALAKSRNLPLLFKGNDFAATDIQLATL
jgi:ribonuclease VapC